MSANLAWFEIPGNDPHKRVTVCQDNQGITFGLYEPAQA